MRQKMLQAVAACVALGLGLFGSSSALAQEKAKPKEPEKVKIAASSEVSNSGWASKKSTMLVAVDAGSYATCWQFAGSPLVDPAPFDEKYVYLFVFGGYTGESPGVKVEVTGITREYFEGSGNRKYDTITVQTTITEPGGLRVLDSPRSPCTVLRIERSELKPALSGKTRFVLNEKRVVPIVQNARNLKYYAPGGRWIVSYKAGESKKALAAVEKVGLKVVEDDGRGVLHVEVVKDTHIKKIDGLPQATDAITKVGPNFSVQTSGGSKRK